jgi:TRAP-type mannitol/chloroaromatic compound transport system substrate-binding protein
MINLDKWNQLPKRYQSIIVDAAAYTNSEVTAKNDARNPAALRRLLAGGTELRPFSQPIMQACLKASNEVNAETAAGNEDFKRVLESMQAFRNEEYFWWQVAEYSYDTFMTQVSVARIACSQTVIFFQAKKPAQMSGRAPY